MVVQLAASSQLVTKLACFLIKMVRCSLLAAFLVVLQPMAAIAPV